MKLKKAIKIVKELEKHSHSSKDGWFGSAAICSRKNDCKLALSTVLNALYKPDQEKIEKILEGYKFPIFTATNEYGDSEEVTREDLAKEIAEGDIIK